MSNTRSSGAGDRPAWNAVAAVCLYAGAVFVLGAASAGMMHALLGALGLAPGPLHEWTADWLKLLALIALWPLLAFTGHGWRDGLGVRCGGRGAAGVALGLLFGVASMALVVAVLLLAGVRVVRPELEAGALASAGLKAVITALLVASIEELWFRGALHRVLRTAGAGAAIGTVAAIYAALHFVRPDGAVPEPYSLLDGFQALAGMFGRFSDANYLDSAAALLAAGVLLGVLRERSGCIAASFGCHAGWVLVLQFSRRTTEPGSGTLTWLAGKYDGIIGVAFIVVIACLAWMWVARSTRWQRLFAGAADAGDPGRRCA